MSISSRYLSKLEQLNSARLVPDHFVMSPEAFYELQQENPIYITPKTIYYELQDYNTGLKGYLFGISVIVDPDLKGNEVFLEIAV